MTLAFNLVTNSIGTEESYTFKYFKKQFETKGVNLIPFSASNFNQLNHDEIQFYIYFDYNWKYWLKDKTIQKIPRDKRVLIMGEPSNVNPSLYYISYLRDLFETVFCWDLNLLRKEPSYTEICVPAIGIDYSSYRNNPAQEESNFGNKLFLTAVTANRWSYMPTSCYTARKDIYRYFQTKTPARFDLYGRSWNKPANPIEKIFGFEHFSSWKGEIEGSYSQKIKLLSRYKFAICFENNASQAGYISEKILHCFCARCIPIYFGSESITERIPANTFINWRDFKNHAELNNYLQNMNEETYNIIIDAINNFIHYHPIGA